MGARQAMTNLKRKPHNPKKLTKAELRIGPRPLPLYLALAHMLWLSLPAASQILKNDLPNLKALESLLPKNLQQKRKQLREHLQILKGQILKGQILKGQILKGQQQQQHDANAEPAFDEALHSLAATQYKTFLDALTRYRSSTIAREANEPPVVWSAGGTRLLDFSAKKYSKPVVLVIPSLINRYHVLDIDKEQSFVRALAAQGFRPLLLDWGVPGSEEANFSFDDYLSKRLFSALNLAKKMQGGPVHVIGYCMGGLLAAALATHASDAIRSLTFLATPWDFQADGGEQAARVKKMLPQIEPILQTQGELPIDVLQCFFISLQPFAILDKFLRFAAMKPRSTEERAFILIEDWVNEGVPLVGKVARTCLQGWYIENTPVLGTWKVLGKAIRPQDIKLPSLHVIPQNDKIVPPASAKVLAGAMRQATVIQPEFGHISMMVNGAARDKVWPELFSWLASH